MDKYNYFNKGGVRPSDEQLLDTKLFYTHSVEIFSRYDDWKDIDKFYFTPLYMRMTYSCAGWAAEIAADPVWLGSFVRSVIEHPDLYTYRCPNCGKVVQPYRLCGSPLSGRVDLEGRCECGWSGFESVTGWRIRANALRDQIGRDTFMYRKFKIFHSGGAATIGNLLEFLK